MKFTRSWLQEYVSDSELDTAQLAEKLTMLGLEVEAVQELYQDLAPLRTGHILSAEKHPDADRLQVCEVQVGEEILQIVCGAPNARKGLNVVVALPGVVLPGSFKIKKSKVRGVASAGMMCSERELGLSEEHNGIMELPADVAHGQSFVEVMGLAACPCDRQGDLCRGFPLCCGYRIARVLPQIRRPDDYRSKDWAFAVVAAQPPSFCGAAAHQCRG